LRIRQARGFFAAAATVCGLVAGATGVVGGQAPSAPGQLLAGQVFKNVQVLKDVPADDFLTVMGLMTAAVGGDCSECHLYAGTAKVDWAADTATKSMARKMSAMVLGINRDSFGGRPVVSCWTCHRGRSRPMATPMLDTVYGTPALEPDDFVPSTAPGLPAPETIIDRYLEALGGAKKLNSVTSFTATGTSLGFRGFGGGGSVQIYAKRPDQRSVIIEYKNTPGRDATVRSYDGTSGWIKTPLNVLGEYQLSGSELDGARLDAQLTFPDQIKQVLTRLRTLDPDEINGTEVDVVQGNGPRSLFATLYFDKATGLLVRSVRYGSSPIGRLPTQVDYSDYRDVGGIKVPFKFTFTWLDGRDVFQLDNARVNVPIEVSKFGRPASLEQRK
jgi:hypothetical protein